MEKNIKSLFRRIKQETEQNYIFIQCKITNFLYSTFKTQFSFLFISK
jgi:hypothetical protein